ncbi:hypothetical protein N7495_001938 [Penicillium taxi]|uniref:uncharacterized protein n=1 Tax=Penicillium taxi TaxID=168475 RepID=UPI0025454B09|nr:uncharacterized protein N7495_001938 [Penicillium taxi]KAJ5909256.1 hypothetical protein N7495_001938 [Penicillium taxi]
MLSPLVQSLATQMTGVLPITVTPITFDYMNTNVPTATSDPGYAVTGTALFPTASDTILDSYDYENPSNYTQCVDMASDYGILMNRLVS